MSAWQAYNYLGCLLYPFKVLAQHKISVSPVEIPCCLRSYGKLTFVVERAVAVTKAAQGRTRLASLIPVTCHTQKVSPSLPGVITHSQECCPDFLSTGPTFLPSPNTFLLLHSMVLFFTVCAFGTRAGVSGRAMLLGSASQLWVEKLRICSLLWLGCWDRRWYCVWQLCLLPGEQPWTSGSPLDAESPDRQKQGDCFLAGSSVVCTWEQIHMNILFVFFFLSAVPSSPLCSPQSLLCFCLLLNPCLCLGFWCCYHTQAGSS